MKMDIRRYGIQIIPENDEDEAYIEEVLGLTTITSEASCTRKNAIGMQRIAYINICKKED